MTGLGFKGKAFRDCDSRALLVDMVVPKESRITSFFWIECLTRRASYLVGPANNAFHVVVQDNCNPLAVVRMA